MNAHACKENINEFFRSLKGNLALAAAPHSVEEAKDGETNLNRLTWARGHNEKGRRRTSVTTVDDYLEAMNNSSYSLIMIDGGLVQISMDFDGSNLVGYRYVFLPCPVLLEGSYLSKAIGQGGSIADCVGRFYENGDQKKFVIRAPFRFEYSRNDDPNGHPRSHVHLGTSGGRLAVSHRVTVGRFLKFIFSNFYHHEFKDFKYSSLLRELSPKEDEPADKDRCYDEELYFRQPRSVVDGRGS